MIGGLVLLMGWFAWLLLRLAWGAGEERAQVAEPGRVAAEKANAVTRRVHSLPQSATLIGNTALLRLSLRDWGLRGIALIGALLIVEQFATDPLGRWVLNRLESQSDVRLTYGKVTGGLLSGGVTLHQVHAIQENHPAANFNLRAESVTVQLTAWKLLGPTLDIDQLWIAGVKGTYERLRKPQKGDPQEPGRSGDGISNAGLQIGKLVLIDGLIDFTDHAVEGDPIQCQLAIETLECPRVRSSSAAYDLLFRSEVVGTINAHPFLIRTTSTDQEVITEWRADQLPIQFARAYLEGPFRWLRTGELDVHVEQHRPSHPKLPVTLESRLALRNIQPGVPADTKPAVAIASQLLISQLKEFPKERDLGFTLKLDPDKFDLTRIEDRDELWNQYKAAAVAALLQTAAVSPDGVPDATQEQLDQAVDRLTNRALKAIEKIRIRREARKAAKQKPAPAPNP